MLDLHHSSHNNPSRTRQQSRSFLCKSLIVVAAVLFTWAASATAHADNGKTAEKLEACLLREYALTEERKFEATMACYSRAIVACQLSGMDDCRVAATGKVEADFRAALDKYLADQATSAGLNLASVKREEQYTRLLLRHVSEKNDLACKHYKEQNVFLGIESDDDVSFLCKTYRSLQVAHFILGRLDHHNVYKYIRKK